MDRAAAMAAMAAREIRPLKIKGWGGLFVCEMSARDMSLARKLAEADEAEDNPNPVSRSAIFCAGVLCDERGTLMFDMRKQDDLEFLASQGGVRLDLVLVEAGKLRKLLEDAEEGNG